MRTQSLKSIIKSKNLTYEQVSEDTNLTVRYLDRIICGRAIPTIVTKILIANAVGVAWDKINWNIERKDGGGRMSKPNEMLKRAMLAKGFTNDGLSIETGIPLPFINKIVNDGAVPSYTFHVKICTALDLPIFDESIYPAKKNIPDGSAKKARKLTDKEVRKKLQDINDAGLLFSNALNDLNERIFDSNDEFKFGPEFQKCKRLSHELSNELIQLRKNWRK